MPEPTILDTIVARRKLDVGEAKLAKPAQALQAAGRQQSQPDVG